MRTIASLLAATLLAAALPIRAQEKKDSGSAVYKVEFNIHDGNDAAAKAGRRYTILIDDLRKGVFQVGDRVPVATGSFQPGAGGNTLVNTQFSYFDVGVNIDCMVSDTNGKIVLRSSLGLSTIVQHPTAAGSGSLPNPTVGQTKLDVETTVELGKPAVVASIDDPVNSRKLQVEVTVTKVN